MPSELTTVAVFDSPLQAAMARNFLEAEGLTAFLADEEAVGMAWHLTGAIGGVKVRVATDQAQKAILLLDRLEQHRSERVEVPVGADDEPDQEFLHGELDEEAPLSTADELADRAFKAALIGLLLCPLQLYSMWLLASLLTLGEAPSPKMRTRAIAAAILDLWFFACAYAVLRL